MKIALTKYNNSFHIMYELTRRSEDTPKFTNSRLDKIET